MSKSRSNNNEAPIVNQSQPSMASQQSAPVDEPKDGGNLEEKLLEAANSGNVKVVRELIKADPKLIEAKLRYGETVLHFAARNKSDAVLKLLIKAGVDLSVKSEDGDTALRYAICNKNPNLFKLLIDADVDGNLAKETLLEAASNREISVLERLIKLDPKLATAQSEDGSTALHLMMKRGNLNEIAPLIKMSDLTIKSKDGSTPIHSAAYYGKVDVVKALLGADSKLAIAKSKDGSTAIHIAARHAHKDVVELLIDYGVDLTAKLEDGSNLLHIVALHAKGQPVTSSANVVRATGKVSKYECYVDLDSDIYIIKMLLDKKPELLLEKNNAGEVAWRAVVGVFADNKVIVDAILSKLSALPASDEVEEALFALKAIDVGALKALEVAKMLEATVALMDGNEKHAGVEHQDGFNIVGSALVRLDGCIKASNATDLMFYLIIVLCSIFNRS